VTARLVVVGGGNMGAALIGGLIASAWAPADELAVVEPLADRREVLKTQYPGVRVTGAPGELGAPVADAVIAVKPPDVPAVAAALAEAGAQRVLSIAAGVPTTAIEAALGTDAAVVRAMPNTPALVRQGASAIAAGSRAGPAEMDWAASILGAVGVVVAVPEKLLDAVTGLSGSGPAYVFLAAEALIEAGVRAGLPREISRDLTIQLFVGSAALLAGSGQSPEALRAAVTSPGGTTAAGLRSLEEAGFRAALSDAVQVATERSRQLGGA
jgi:pyrroline-5-carboxylate reductase